MIYINKDKERVLVPVKNGADLPVKNYFSLWLQSSLLQKVFVLKVRPSDLEKNYNDILSIYVFLSQDIKDGEYEYFLTDYDPEDWERSAIQKNDIIIYNYLGSFIFEKKKIYASGLAKIERK